MITKLVCCRPLIVARTSIYLEVMMDCAYIEQSLIQPLPLKDLKDWFYVIFP
jgi:hypothetical protein